MFSRIKRSLILTSLGCAPAAIAQPARIPAPSAIQILAADFNGDGKPDLLIQQTTNSPNDISTLTVLPGKGDGTFSTPIITSISGVASVLTTADFNGDGKLDLVIDGGDLYSYIALGNGDGTFRTGPNDLIAINGRVVGVADFNGDGKPDLLSALNQNNGFAILFGNGDATFTPVGGISSDNVPESFPIVLGDVNLDGLDDIITSSTVLLSNGDGTFRYVPFHPGEGLAGPGAIADLNGDGNPDIVYAFVEGSAIADVVLFGNGDGTFRLGDFGLGSGSPQAQDTISANPAIADFNRDGAPDVAFVSTLYGLTILVNYGDGTLITPALGGPYGLNPLNNNLTGPLALADFNGDGKPDLAVVDQSAASTGTAGPTEVSVLLNSTPLQFPVILGGVVNAASGRPAPLSPGSLASAYTLPQPFALQTAASLPLPSSLENAALLLNSNPVPLLAISPRQLNFQVPWELAGTPSATISFETDASSIYPTIYRFPLQPGWAAKLATYSPGIFTMTGSGTGQGAVTTANSTAIAAPAGAFPGSRPASRGDYITILCNGLGPVSNQPASGAPALANPLSATIVTPVVIVGGIDAPVQFSGLAPGFVGVNQVNVQVPATAAVGNAVSLVIRTADGSTSNVVTIAVK